MTTRQKLIRVIRKADLSGFNETAALILYEVNGLPSALEYVNQIMIDKKVGVLE